MRVLIIDDDPALRQLMRITLIAHGYEVLDAATGQDGVTAAALHQPDLILLDLHLPDLSGIDVVRQIRAWASTPIIMLSVQKNEMDKVKALDAGADDYLTKPAAAGELLARMRVALRRITRQQEDLVFQVGDLHVDLNKRQVRVAGSIVQLTPREYDLLRVLVSHAGKVVTTRYLMQSAWGEGHMTDTYLLRVHMSNLRSKIEPNSMSPIYIITESGVGYRLTTADT